MGTLRRGAGGFLLRAGRVLLGKRSPNRSLHPGTWDVIGGHCEVGESPACALVRELEEEVGVTATEFREIGVLDEPDAPAHGEAECHIYLVTTWGGGEPKRLGTEHSDLRWFTPDEARELDLAHPGYRVMLERLEGP